MMRLGARTLLAVAVVAAVIGLLFWVWRRRAVVEGWEYENKETRLSAEHALQVQRWCLEGRKAGRLTRDDAYMHLQKYSAEAVRQVCRDKRDAWLKGVHSGKTESVVESKCSGGRVCGVAALRVTHPCANSDFSKCCLYATDWDKKGDIKYLKNCVETTGFTKNAVEGPKQRDAGRRDWDATTDGLGADGAETKKWKCMRDGIKHMTWNVKGPFTTTLDEQQKAAAAWCNAQIASCAGRCEAVRCDKNKGECA